MIHIRPARYEDIEKAIPIYREFAKETMGEFNVGFDEARVIHQIIQVIDNHYAIVLEVDGELVGFFGAIRSGLMFNPSLPCMFEMTWYVKPEHRGLGSWMLTRFERDARARGIKKICVGHTGSKDPKVFGRFYRQRGYKLFEVHYIKEL